MKNKSGDIFSFLRQRGTLNRDKTGSGCGSTHLKRTDHGAPDHPSQGSSGPGLVLAVVGRHLVELDAGFELLHGLVGLGLLLAEDVADVDRGDAASFLFLLLGPPLAPPPLASLPLAPPLASLPPPPLASLPPFLGPIVKSGKNLFKNILLRYLYYNLNLIFVMFYL